MITVSLPRHTIISANRNLHYHVKANMARQLRSQAFWIAKAAKETYPGPVDMIITFSWPPTARRRDRMNLSLTIKHLVDGMVDAGVIEDDNDKIIRSEHLVTADEPCQDAYGVVLDFEFHPIEVAA
jgi:hypothetical protein